MRVTVSGSFNRHLAAVQEAVAELHDRGVEVLSPADPRIVGDVAGFAFVASDRTRSIKMVQNRHLECIAASDFLWLVTPDGYVGSSAAFELGYAVSHEIPVFATNFPDDLTLRQYVTFVPNLAQALANVRMTDGQTEQHPLTFRINPHDSADVAAEFIAALQRHLNHPAHLIDSAKADLIEEARNNVVALLNVPGKGAR